VVPTRDRPAALARCLDAIAAQTDPPDEVVVVDDASTDADVVARVAAAHADAGVRLVRGEGRGPAAARNLGARSTDAQLVCFTDDDCRPSPGWTSALGATGAPAAAGPTAAGDPRRRLDAAAQVVTNHLTASSLDPATSTVGFAPTCNLAVCRAVVDEVPFDEDFPLAAGEDREWCDRLLRLGHHLAWVPEATVEHHPDLDLGRFWRQQVRYGRGGQRLRHLRPEAGRLQAPTFYLDLLKAGAAEGPTVAALVVLAQAATTVGVLQEARAATQTKLRA
jgi:GT2 family glycosyltransferase